MTDLVVRRLLIDLERPIERHWHGGDAFRSAYLGALSMSFPIGEQFFIDSVRDGVKSLPADRQARWQPEVQGFVGQEATHRRIHALFNGHLAKLGYANRWEERVAKRIRRFEHLDIRHKVATTAAYEHFTALLAEHLLAHPEQLAGVEPRLQTLWLWHAAEEAEHKCTAFDVYRSLGGNERWRRRWFRITTFFFLTDSLRQTANNLWHDGELFSVRTWASGLRFFFGKGGLVRECFGPWRRYTRPDFHPSQQDSSRSEQWLRDNADQYSVVSSPMREANGRGAAIEPNPA